MPLFIKTKKTPMEEIIRLITENHSYDMPEVITLPIMRGNPAYLEWIDSVIG